MEHEFSGSGSFPGRIDALSDTLLFGFNNLIETAIRAEVIRTCVKMDYTCVEVGYTCVEVGYTCVEVDYICVEAGYTCVEVDYTCVEGSYTCVEVDYTCVEVDYTCVEMDYTCVEMDYTCVEVDYTCVEMDYTCVEVEPTQAETGVNRLKRWVLRRDSIENEYFVGNFFISLQLTLPKTGDTPRKAVLCTMQEKLLQNWEKKSGERVKEYKKFLHRANKNKTLRQLPDLNEQAFEKIDCLQCANCCKNYSPRFTPPDIKRISKFLGMKEGDFKDTYLKEDEDGDNVTKTKPCPFLGEDNYCSIYEVRPTDCVRFPYMDDDFMLKRQPLVLKNISFCPITYYVIEKLIEVEKGKSSGA